MSKKAFLLPLLFLFVIASSSFTYSVKGQAGGLDFRFRALVEGQCLVAYGGMVAGSGAPYPITWSGLADGQATIGGHATDATTFPSTEDLYISDNIRANGAVTVRWKETDGGKHRLAVVLYSTATSEGLFSPSRNQFELSTPEYSQKLESFILFRAVYVNGAESVSISGVAVFYAGLAGPAPDSALLLLVDIQSGTLFLIGWSSAGTPTPFPPGYVPAAKVYNTIVEEL